MKKIAATRNYISKEAVPDKPSELEHLEKARAYIELARQVSDNSSQVAPTSLDTLLQDINSIIVPFGYEGNYGTGPGLTNPS